MHTQTTNLFNHLAVTLMVVIAASPFLAIALGGSLS